MTMWGGIFLLAVAGSTAFADPRLSFPEVARAAGSRIVSGWEAEEGQFPHQFSLRMVSSVGAVSACGGSIISSGWGLTAAHCTATRISFVIRAGTVNMTRPGAIFETTEFHNHPLYNNNLPGVVQPHDISLLKFNRHLEFSATIQPIRLQRAADKDRNYAGVTSIASGWGNTWTQGSSPENLNWVFLSLTSNAACWAAYNYSPIIQPSTICAENYNVTSQSTCQGDSGGPLTIVDDDSKITQVGVTSFVSATGCHTGYPAGFIRTGYYHDWYRSITNINFEEPHTTTTEAAPEDTTTEAAPEDTTTEAAPEDTTTEAAPEDTTTEAAPEDTTTEAAPEDTTTEAAPEDTTTEAVPEDTTTEAAPEDTTEAATETPEVTETTTEADVPSEAPTTTDLPEETTTFTEPTSTIAESSESEESSESSESDED